MSRAPIDAEVYVFSREAFLFSIALFSKKILKKQKTMLFRKGDRVLALDDFGEWQDAVLVDARAGGRVKVHYVGWPANWDEWITASAERLVHKRQATRRLSGSTVDAVWRSCARPGRLGAALCLAAARLGLSRERARHAATYMYVVKVGLLAIACLLAAHAVPFMPTWGSGGAAALPALPDDNIALPPFCCSGPTIDCVPDPSCGVPHSAAGAAPGLLRALALPVLGVLGWVALARRLGDPPGR